MRRGLTWHEHLDNVGLVHMNGRVYDPAIGRFASADPFVQAPYDSQGLNRYSYVGNNPLSFIDPSGFPQAPPNPDNANPNRPPPTWRGDPWDWHWPRINSRDICGINFCNKRRPPTPVPTGGPRGDSAEVPLPVATLASNDNDLIDCDEMCEMQRLRGQQAETLDKATHALSMMGNFVEAMAPVAGLPLLKGIGFVAKHGIWTSTKGRTAAQNAFKHWQDHRNEFPELLNAKQYVQYANAFTRNPPTGTLTRVRPNGDRIYYHPESNIFAVTDANGTVRTMFRPNPSVHGYPSNLEYFDGQ